MSDQIGRWVSAGYHRPLKKKEKAIQYLVLFTNNLSTDYTQIHYLNFISGALEAKEKALPDN